MPIRMMNILLALACGLFIFSAQAQVLSPTSQSAKSFTVNKSKADAPQESLFQPAQKNFGNKKLEMVEPKDDPQVFHFKIVNGKVTVEDPDKRNILIYYDNYKLHRSFDNLIKCSMRVYVINDLKENITSLGVKLKWPDISTSVEMRQVKKGVKTYTDIMLLGEGCLRLDRTPTIEVNRCRVKGMSQDACADAIKWLSRR